MNSAAHLNLYKAERAMPADDDAVSAAQAGSHAAFRNQTAYSCRGIV